MGFRSISPIIAIIVLIVITVGLAGLAYFFFSGTVSQMFITSTHKMQQTTGTIIQCSRVSGDISAYANFRYRIPIIIQENSGNNLTNYQVHIIVNTQALISEGKMNPDCSDIRFTYLNNSNNQEVEIPYWIESRCDTTNTSIWVKVPYIPANSNVTIYMYYGNPGATSESNPYNVFIYFDTFTNLSGWQTYKGSSCTYIGVGNFNGTNVLNLTVNGGNGNSITWCIVYNNNISLPSSFKIDVDVYTNNIVDTLPYFNSITGPFYVFRFDTRSGAYDLIGYYPAGGTITQPINWTSGSSQNTWYHMQVIRLSNGTWYLYKGGNLDSLGNLEVSATDTNTTSGYLGLSGDGATGTTYFANLVVREYVSPEPSVYLGQEQDLPPLIINLINTGSNLGNTFDIKITYADGRTEDYLVTLNQTLSFGSTVSIPIYNLSSGIITNIKVYSVDVCPGSLVANKYVNIEI